MLLELRVENYAVIDHAIAAFGPGLNLLTGETGAGKSLLVDALALLTGEKASSELVRHGAERAAVACVFESTDGAETVLSENGVEPQGGEILLRREISASGKGRVFVDNQLATAGVLKRLAPELVLIHQQADTLSAFDAEQQRGLVDRFGEIATASVANAFHAWREASEKLAELEQGEQERLRMLDLWQFQQKELDAADLRAGEDAELEAEKRVLANAERVFTAANAINEELYEAEPSALALVRTAQKQAQELSRLDPRWLDSVQQLDTAAATLEDVAATARDYASNISASPERIAEIEDRLALLDSLKRKYAGEPRAEDSLAQVIAFGEQVRGKLSEVENRDALLAGLRAEAAEAARKYVTEARTLSRLRQAVAGKLEKTTEKHIKDLAMQARFAISVTPSEDRSAWTQHGWDTVECRIATAAGAPLRPLVDIASGGEMSRVLLALKVAVEEHAGRRRKIALPRTLVFDEIDIGIGGRAAEAVGQKLKELARGQQVLCVTHLPQIAAFADQHLVVEKQEARGKTTTSVRVLTDKERTDEIARMLSGATLTDASRKHAREMIAASRG